MGKTCHNCKYGFNADGSENFNCNPRLKEFGKPTFCSGQELWEHRYTAHEQALVKLKARQMKQLAQVEAKEAKRQARIVAKAAKKEARADVRAFRKEKREDKKNVVRTAQASHKRAYDNTLELQILKEKLATQSQQLAAQADREQQREQALQDIKAQIKPIDMDAIIAQWEMKKSSEGIVGDGIHTVGELMEMKKEDEMKKTEASEAPKPNSFPTKDDSYDDVCPKCTFGPDPLKCDYGKCMRSKGYLDFHVKTTPEPTPEPTVFTNAALREADCDKLNGAKIRAKYCEICALGPYYKNACRDNDCDLGYGCPDFVRKPKEETEVALTHNYGTDAAAIAARKLELWPEGEDYASKEYTARHYCRKCTSGPNYHCEKACSRRSGLEDFTPKEEDTPKPECGVSCKHSCVHNEYSWCPHWKAEMEGCDERNSHWEAYVEPKKESSSPTPEPIVERKCSTCKFSSDNNQTGLYCNAYRVSIGLPKVKKCDFNEYSDWEQYVKPSPEPTVDKSCDTCQYGKAHNPDRELSCRPLRERCGDYHRDCWDQREWKPYVKADAEPEPEVVKSCDTCQFSSKRNGKHSRTCHEVFPDKYENCGVHNPEWALYVEPKPEVVKSCTNCKYCRDDVNHPLPCPLGCSIHGNEKWELYVKPAETTPFTPTKEAFRMDEIYEACAHCHYGPNYQCTHDDQWNCARSDGFPLFTPKETAKASPEITLLEPAPKGILTITNNQGIQYPLMCKKCKGWNQNWKCQNSDDKVGFRAKAFNGDCAGYQPTN